MASIPCLKSESRCTPCAGDSSNPFANLSIEPFDRNIWLGVYFGRPRNVTPNSWTTDACVGFCESAISQVDADDCARRRADDCLTVEPPYDDPPPPEPPVTPALFCNQEVSCQSGSNCYTLPACTVFAGSQAEADAIAQSMCDSRVLDPNQTGPCATPAPPPAPPEPPPAVPCTECCNCGAVVQIENYAPSFFTFDPALLDANDSTSDCNAPPQPETLNLSTKTFVIDEGWTFCLGEVWSALFFFFKQFGSWFRLDSAGFCTFLVDARVLTSPLEAYPAGEPFDGVITLKHYPYDLGFGTGAWNGQFTLTDDSLNTCAIQYFPTQHIDGLGGFIVQLDQSGSGPSSVWTISVKKYYSTATLASCSIMPLDDWWIGEHVGETQCGTYNKTGGELFTGPASLNIVAVT